MSSDPSTASAPQPASRRPTRARLVAAPLALLLAVSLIVYGLARAHPFEKDVSAAPVATGDATRGQAIFATTCAGCHGPDAGGGVGPALRDNPIALPDAVAVIRAGRGVMPGGLVSGADEGDLTAFLTTILASATPE